MTTDNPSRKAADGDETCPACGESMRNCYTATVHKECIDGKGGGDRCEPEPDELCSGCLGATIHHTCGKSPDAYRFDSTFSVCPGCGSSQEHLRGASYGGLGHVNRCNNTFHDPAPSADYEGLVGKLSKIADRIADAWRGGYGANVIADEDAAEVRRAAAAIKHLRQVNAGEMKSILRWKERAEQAETLHDGRANITRAGIERDRDTAPIDYEGLVGELEERSKQRGYDADSRLVDRAAAAIREQRKQLIAARYVNRVVNAERREAQAESLRCRRAMEGAETREVEDKAVLAHSDKISEARHSALQRCRRQLELAEKFQERAEYRVLQLNETIGIYQRRLKKAGFPT